MGPSGPTRKFLGRREPLDKTEARPCFCCGLREREREIRFWSEICRLIEEDEHWHHCLGEAPVPRRWSESSIHKSRRKLQRPRLPPFLHHRRRFRHRRLSFRSTSLPFSLYLLECVWIYSSIWRCVGIKPGIKGPSMVTGGLIGLMGGFMYAYQNSAGRLMGFFPNEGEVASCQKRGGFPKWV